MNNKYIQLSTKYKKIFDPKKHTINGEPIEINNLEQIKIVKQWTNIIENNNFAYEKELHEIDFELEQTVDFDLNFSCFMCEKNVCFSHEIDVEYDAYHNRFDINCNAGGIQTPMFSSCYNCSKKYELVKDKNRKFFAVLIG